MAEIACDLAQNPETTQKPPAGCLRMIFKETTLLVHTVCMEYSILTTLVVASHHKNFPKGYKTAAYKDASILATLADSLF